MNHTFRWLAAPLVGLVFLGGCVAQPAPVRTPAVPASDGVASVALGQRVEDYIQNETAAMENVRAVLVVIDGQTTLEHYRHGFTATDHEHLWSVTKSVIATLVGIAIGEGLLPELDSSLWDLLPEYRKVMTPTAATVTLRQLMNHTSGFIGDNSLEWTVLTARTDAVAWTLSREEAKLGPPGKDFRYSSLGSHIVAAVLDSALQRNPSTKGQSVLGYARTRLFDPLGIITRPALELSPPDFTGPGFGWARSGKVEVGGWGLRLTAPDLAKLGQLYLDDGTWHGNRLLPEGWVAEATTAGPVASNVGLLWWREDDGGFAARGFEGQRIVVIPDKRAVIVTLCVTGQGDYPLDEIDDLIETVIRPALR